LKKWLKFKLFTSSSFDILRRGEDDGKKMAIKGDYH